MGLMESLRLSLEGLRANKMRSLLTMLGIIIGIASVIGILTVGDGLSDYITDTMSTMGASTITVSLQERDDQFSPMSMMGFGASDIDRDDRISMDMIEELQSRYAEDIKAVSLTENAGSGQAKDGRLYANVSVTGVNEDYFVANETDLLDGRLIQDADSAGQRMVCVVSNKLVNNMFDGNTDEALGSEILVELSGGRHRFRIVGIYEYEANPMMMTTASDKDISTSMFIPLSTAKQLAGAEDGFTTLTVISVPEADSVTVAQTVERFLNRYYSRNKDFSVTAVSMDSIIETMGDMMDTLSIAISVIAAISLLVGGIGVMNIMLVSVTERTREIGTRKALGATNGNIRIQFVAESAVICLIGGLIGILLGGILGYVGSSLMQAPALPGIGSILLAVGFSLAVGIFFGYYPANKAAKMDPIEALRYE